MPREKALELARVLKRSEKDAQIDLVVMRLEDSKQIPVLLTFSQLQEFPYGFININHIRDKCMKG